MNSFDVNVFFFSKSIHHFGTGKSLGTTGFEKGFVSKTGTEKTIPLEHFEA